MKATTICCTRVRRFLILTTFLLPLWLVQCSPSRTGGEKEKLSLVRFQDSSSSIAPFRSQASSSKPRFAYLEGFGTSGIQERIPGDGDGNDDDDFASSLLAKYGQSHSPHKIKHILASFLSLALFGTLLSQPLWKTHAETMTGYKVTLTVAVILYLLEAGFSSTRKYLSNMMTPREVQDLLTGLQETLPLLRWDLECYHYQTSYTRRANGRVEQIRTKVVTHRSSQAYLYKECTDKTNVQRVVNALEFTSAFQNPFLKITLAKLLVFRDVECYQDYLNQLGLFVVREGNRDRHMNIVARLEAPQFRSQRILAVRTVIGVQEHVRPVSFWLFTLLGLTVPYRIWFDTHCDDVDVILTKEVQ